MKKEKKKEMGYLRLVVVTYLLGYISLFFWGNQKEGRCKCCLLLLRKSNHSTCFYNSIAGPKGCTVL